MKFEFSEDAWEQYLHWQTNDKNTLKKINKLMKDISRNPSDGLGKPELLKKNLSGWSSRRINDEDRLVYRYNEDTDVCEISQCKGHYDN